MFVSTLINVHKTLFISLALMPSKFVVSRTWLELTIKPERKRMRAISAFPSK